jgi:hypothetical protein
MKKSVSKTTKQNPDLNKKLVENFVSLQKVMANLSMKFDNLSDQISKLLELFEISAKAMAEKDYEVNKDSDDKKIVERLDALLEQNKVIAKGLSMLHEGENSKEESVQQREPNLLPKMNGQLPRRLLPSEQSRLQKRPQSYY